MIKKRCVSVLLLLTTLLLLMPACGVIQLLQLTSPSEGESLIACASYGVPGMASHDLKEPYLSYNILETDSEGRILYEYTARNSFSNRINTVLVICQKYTDDSVSYYEDVCYTYEWVADSPNELEAFKAANDWGLPLNRDKMAKRKYSITLDNVLKKEKVWGVSYYKALAAARQALGYSEDEYIDSFSLGLDAKGQELLLIKTRADGIDRMHVAFVNVSYQVEILTFETFAFDRDAFVAFKHHCGYAYHAKTPA